MSLTYITEPLTQAAAGMFEHLPTGVVPSNDNRFPSPNEMLAICSSLPDYTVVRNDVLSAAFYVEIERCSDSAHWAAINFSVDPNDLDLPARFVFDRCDPKTAFSVLKAVAALCGPHVYLDDTLVEPLIVQGSDSVDDLLEYYDAYQIGDQDQVDDDEGPTLMHPTW